MSARQMKADNMVSTSGSSDHNQRHCLGRQHWRAVFWPLMLITSVGMASILFLISCARVSELELTAYRLERQIDEQQAARSRLWQTVSRLYDRSELRRFVNNEGMILVTNGTTKVTLPPLPPEQWVISPLTAHREALGRQRPPEATAPELAARGGELGALF